MVLTSPACQHWNTIGFLRAAWPLQCSTLQLVITDIKFLSPGHKQRSQFVPHTKATARPYRLWSSWHYLLTTSVAGMSALEGCLDHVVVVKKYIGADYSSDAWQTQIKWQPQLQWWQHPPNNISNTLSHKGDDAKTYNCNMALFLFQNNIRTNYYNYSSICKRGKCYGRVEGSGLRKRGQGVCAYGSL